MKVRSTVRVSAIGKTVTGTRDISSITSVKVMECLHGRKVTNMKDSGKPVCFMEKEHTYRPTAESTMGNM